VKKLFMGVPVERAVSRDALANPQAIQFFLDYVQQAWTAGKVSSFAGKS
jgi:acetoacetyl-CoA synthetase